MKRKPNPYSKLNQSQKLKLLLKTLKEGDIEAANWLLEYKLDVNRAKDADGHTAMDIACRSGYVEIAQKLLEKGSGVNAVEGEDGPLHIACKSGQLEIVKWLLGSGARINQHGKWGWTPLIYAAAIGRSLEIVRLLLKTGADIKAVNANEENVLYRMIFEENPDPEIVVLLLENGLDVQDNNFYFGTALHWAAKWGRPEIVRLLLEKGAGVNVADKREEATPVIWAMERGCHEVVKILFANGANPFSVSRFGDSLIEYAAGSGDRELTALIMQKIKMDPEYAKPEKSYQVTKALARAVAKGDEEIAGFLICQGADPNAPSGVDLETALIKAAHYNNPAIVKLLLQSGAQIKSRDKRGNTALLHAAWCGFTDNVRLLLENQADINETNDLNWNALMQACSEGHIETARLLLEKGSPLDTIDFEMGYTVLNIAELRENRQLLELLKSYGAKPRIIKWRLPEQPYISIFDCDVCKYLSHSFKLPSSYEARTIEGLDNVYRDVESTDNYTDFTNIIKKCRNCGTYYNHYHYIDTEDAASSGVRESQNLQRYNLLKLKDTLKRLDLKKELYEFEERYPGLILEIEQQLGNKQFGSYVLENLIDFYIVNNYWDKMKTKILMNGNPDDSLFAIFDLAAIWGITPSDDKFPGFHAVRSIAPGVKEAAMPFIKTHLAELRLCLEQWKDSPDSRIKSLYEGVLNSAENYKLFCRK